MVELIEVPFGGQTHVCGPKETPCIRQDTYGRHWLTRLNDRCLSAIRTVNYRSKLATYYYFMMKFIRQIGIQKHVKRYSVFSIEKERILEIISTLLRQIEIPPPRAPPGESLYKDQQSNRRVGVFQIRSRNSRWTEVHQFFSIWQRNVRRLKDLFRLLIYRTILEKWAKKSDNHEILANFDPPPANFFRGSPQNFETSFGYFFSGTIARKNLDHAA